jgi:transposase InsO family protein
MLAIMPHILVVLLRLLSRLLILLLKPNGAKALLAENLLLRQQLLLLRRSRRRSPNLRPCDRLFFGVASLCLQSRRLARAALIVRPSTLLRCHRALTRLKLRWLYCSVRTRRKPGPKGPGPELIAAILELKRRNSHLGCPKIAEQLAKSFGIELDKDTVRRVLTKYHRRSGGGPDHGPSWLSVLAHAKDSLWSLDLFRVESVLLQTHWVLLVMDVYTRRIIGFGVQAVAVDGPDLCRMFNQAIAGQGLPVRLSFDHDQLFRFHRWQANLRILEIEAVQSVPYAPTSHVASTSGDARFGKPDLLRGPMARAFPGIRSAKPSASGAAQGCHWSSRSLTGCWRLRPSRGSLCESVTSNRDRLGDSKPQLALLGR